MAQKAHVPKFGDWDGDNVPYTTYFENTRKGKDGSTKPFNPNDPEDNPDAFLSGIFPSIEREVRRKDDSNDYSSVKKQQKKYSSTEHSQGYMGTPPRGGRNHKNGKSGYGTITSSENTPTPQRANKHSDESSFDMPASPPRRQSVPKSRRSPASAQNDAMHDTPSSVPRFGAWEEADANSGQGFTQIFNQVKQEKKKSATRLPRVPPSQEVHRGQRSSRAKSSSFPMCSCCMNPSIVE